MPAALPQPDFAALTAGLKQAITQIERVPNIPNPRHDIQELTRLIKALTTTVDDMRTTLDDVQTNVNGIRQTQRLLPMQLANASAGRSAPLRGVQGPLTPPAPRTCEELIGFTANNCIAAAQYLNLPALPQVPAPTVTTQKQQIAEYLGIVVD